MVYPNKGEKYNAEKKMWEPMLECTNDFLGYSKIWIAAGAHAIGGCCRTGPNDIKQLAQYIQSEQL